MKKLCIPLGVLFFSILSCRSNSSENSHTPNEPVRLHNEHVVMVIDSRIDPNHRAYKDKVLASYTLQCGTDSTEDQSSSDNLSIDTLKEMLKKELEKGEPFLFSLEECKLIEGIKTTTQPLPPYVEEKKNDWNNAIKNLDKEYIVKNLSILDFLSSPEYGYHGTNVTAMIAYKNPHVKFILVEKRLGKGEKADENTLKNICSIFHKFNEVFGVLKEKKYHDLAVKNGLLSEKKLLHDLALKHKVTLINKSYGAERQDLREKFEKANCQTTIENYFTTMANLNNIEYEIQRRIEIDPNHQPFLTIQAAGNSGMEVSSTYDLLDCYTAEGAKHQLIVGSYGMTAGREVISNFSNYGACVSLYALGDLVITSNPQDFLIITRGTSFAAPLTVRYLSEKFSPQTNATDMRNKLIASLDHRKFLPPSKVFTYASLTHEEGQLQLAETSFWKKLVINDENKTLNRSLFSKKIPFHFIKNRISLKR